MLGGRNLAGLIAISFLVSVGFGAVNLLLPYYILALKGVLTKLPERMEVVPAVRAVVEYGVMTSAFMVTRAFLAAASGWMSDVVGRKRMIVTGMVMYSILAFAYSLVTGVWQLVALRAVQGVASAMVWPVAEAMIVDSVPMDLRTRALSLYVISFNVGNVIGPLVGAAAYEVSKSWFYNLGVEAVLRAPYAIAALVLLPGLMAALLLRETLPIGGGRKKDRPRLGSLPDPVKVALYSFYSNGLLNGFAMGIVSSIMMAYIIEFIVKEPSLVAVAMSIGGVVGLAISYPFAHMADRMGQNARKWMLVTTGLVSRTAIIGIAFATSYLGFLLVYAVTSIAFNVFMPLLRSIQAWLVPQELRGRVFGLQQAFFNAGMIAGPLVGAALYKYLYSVELAAGLRGPQFVFVIAGLLGYAGIALIAAYYRPSTVEEMIP